MRFSVAVASVLSIAGVYAADHIVTVGENNLLAFNPTSVTAAEGDNVIFQFRSKNHSVTQSTFSSPCTLAPNGIDSGFQATAANATSFATWSFTVNNASAPLWFFCAQTTPAVHCTAGMVFAVNPTADKTFDAYQATAKGENGTTASGSASGASPSATGSTGTAGSGTGTTGSGTGSSSGSASSPAAAASSGTGSAAGAAATNSNGAMQMGANTVSLITLAGLVAGLVL